MPKIITSKSFIRKPFY